MCKCTIIWKCVWGGRFGNQIRPKIFTRIGWVRFMTIRVDTDGYQKLPRFVGCGFIAVGFNMDGYQQVCVFFGIGFIAASFDTEVCPKLLGFFGGEWIAENFCTECDRN